MGKTKVVSFEDPEIWQKSHELTIEIYKNTQSFPKSEQYGLISQLRIASVSIPANIVEGFYRNTTKEFIQFLYHSRGSCGEVIYYLILSKDLKYIPVVTYESLRKEYNILIKRISSMINSLKRRK